MMSNKYLVFTNSGDYVCSVESGYALISKRDRATQYDLDEAIKIRATHPCELHFESVDPLESPLEIFIKPIAPYDTDFNLYAKYTSKAWTQSVSFYRHFIEAPENQEKLQLAIAKLQAYIAKETQNKHYKFHGVTYVGFPLALNVENFAPYFSLEINYGADRSTVINFLVK